jgi:hypothetical protein
VVDGSGIAHVLHAELAPEELEGLRASANVLRGAIEEAMQPVGGKAEG